MAEKKFLDYDGLVLYHGKIQERLDNKVDKETNKSLMSTDEHTKLEGIETSAQVNKIESIKVNNTTQTITNKAVNISVPTKLGDLTNDGNFVTDANYVHTDANFTQAEKTKLSNIAENANKYELPKASATELGGIKVGTGLGINEGGSLYVTGDATVNSVEWDVVQNTPTTLSGYGIADASVSGQTITLGTNSVTVPTTVAELTDAGSYMTTSHAANSITTAKMTSWDGKQDKLTAGTNITIATNGTISAKDTTYTAGDGIEITNDNKIVNKNTSAEWGKITGTLSDQTDLKSALDAKQGTISNTTGITLNNNTVGVDFEEVQRKIGAGEGLSFADVKQTELNIDFSKVMEYFDLDTDSGLEWTTIEEPDPDNPGTSISKKALGIDTTKIATKQSVTDLDSKLTNNYLLTSTFNNTNVSKFTNDAGYQTASQVSTAINTAVGNITSFEYSVVENLPATGVKGTIYLKANAGEADNIYDEYIYVNNKFEKIGTTKTDLSGYVKTEELKSISTEEINTILGISE